MTKFAKLPSRERDLFFRQYQAQFGVDPVIAEKDFWVCWLLKLISETEPLAGHSPVIQFRYPIERSGMVSGYIPRQVKLEFGSLTDQKPVGSRERFSRHYSDFAALWKHDKGPAAAARLDVLEKVRVHKSRFFASAWAHYHTASPGTFRLVPPKRQIPMLRADYQAMRQMFLSEPRPFDDILMILDEAERSLNV